MKNQFRRTGAKVAAVAIALAISTTYAAPPPRVIEAKPSAPKVIEAKPQAPAPLAAKTPPPPIEPKQPPINRQQQAGHVAGTPQHLNRIKSGKPTSTFFGSKSGEALTRMTWETGKPVDGRPQLKERTYPITTGVGPNGGFQKGFRVSMNKKGEMHGTPVGKEIK